MVKPKFRRPETSEQHVLDHLIVRPITPQERKRYQALMEEHHYLHSHGVSLWQIYTCQYANCEGYCRGNSFYGIFSCCRCRWVDIGRWRQYHQLLSLCKWDDIAEWSCQDWHLQSAA